MKILKIIGIIIIVLLTPVLVVALFVPNDYTVSVTTIINKPKQVVFDYVKLIKNQENYSVWILQDPNVKMEYQGTDGTVGFKSTWDSQNSNVGAGSQQITAVSNDRIAVDLHFERPIKGDNKAATVLGSITENQTKVTAEFYGHATYPMNILSLVSKRIIKNAETQNLSNLKKLLEKKD